MVHLESGVLGKPGAAVRALEGLLAGVRPLVQHQGRFGAEGLSALGAHVEVGVTFVHLSRWGGRDTENTHGGFQSF